MPETIRFNLNHHVRVRLTDFGRAEHQRQWQDIAELTSLPYTPPKEDAEGWSEWQLWSLMKTFGPCIYMGMPKVPFETDIELLPES